MSSYVDIWETTITVPIFVQCPSSYYGSIFVSTDNGIQSLSKSSIDAVSNTTRLLSAFYTHVSA